MGKMFDLLKEGLEEAIEYHKGNVTLRTREVSLPDAPKPYQAASIKSLRCKLGISQRELAAWMNVSLNTVQAWEQGTRNPNHASLRLLEVLDKDFFTLAKILSANAAHNRQPKRNTSSSHISSRANIAAKAKG